MDSRFSKYDVRSKFVFRITLILLLCCCLIGLLSACGPDATQEMGTQTTTQLSSNQPVIQATAPASVQTCGVEVVRVGVFEDTLAFGGKRGIYRIVDHCTGQSYIGLSGIGISENGSHASGKTIASDER